MNRIILNDLDELRYGRREAINSLKTNIKFAGNDIKVVAFTSCNPNEGKSTTCFDLAKAFADSGSKVLLIDADMRKTVMLQRYNIDNQGQKVGGLTHYLSGQVALENIINSTNVPNLYMMLAGPLSPNPAELMSGHLIDDLISRCRKVFDMVIIDTPPLGAVIDAAILAPKCDGTIIVLGNGRTTNSQLRNVINQLHKSNSHILGLVRTGADASRGDGYYGYGSSAKKKKKHHRKQN